MTYDELVEKVAQALWDTHGFVNCDDGGDSGQMFCPVPYGEEGEYAPNTEFCRSAARAALSVVYEGMKEPTARMATNGLHLMTDIFLSGSHSTDDAMEIWTAMLDASALKPGEPITRVQMTPGVPVKIPEGSVIVETPSTQNGFSLGYVVETKPGKE